MKCPPEGDHPSASSEQATPDYFFDAAQQQHLAKLTARWRKARDQGQALPRDERAELDDLVEAELRATAARAAALADERGG